MSQQTPISSVEDTSRMFKIVNDSVHGHFELSELALQIIDTPEFQRLRSLKQLGTTSYVFPGAEHTRFTHSLGVYHLARKQMEILRSRQPSLGITDRDVELVSIAGLCHDLGHGPFSHAFEEWINEGVHDRRSSNLSVSSGSIGSRAAAAAALSSSPSTPVATTTTTTASGGSSLNASTSTMKRGHFEHEDMSLRLLKLIIDKHGVPIAAHEYDAIACMISQKAVHSRKCLESVKAWLGEAKHFMLEIVSNSINSIDVDKFDYLLRDSKFTNKPCGFDPVRLMSHCLVIDGMLCYEEKEAYNVYELFRTRYSMFKQVYLHAVSKAIEYMIGDIMSDADERLGISAAIDSPERYAALTDDVLALIEHEVAKDARGASGDARPLTVAAHILGRLRARDLYKCVFSEIYGGDLGDKDANAPPKPHEISAGIVAMAAKSELVDAADDATRVVVTDADFRVQLMKLNYAMGEADPVQSVRFYKKDQTHRKFQIPRDRISFMLPSVFKEYHVRVFVVEPRDVAKCNAIKQAAEAYWGTLVSQQGNKRARYSLR